MKAKTKTKNNSNNKQTTRTKNRSWGNKNVETSLFFLFKHYICRQEMFLHTTDKCFKWRTITVSDKLNDFSMCNCQVIICHFLFFIFSCVWGLIAGKFCKWKVILIAKYSIPFVILRGNRNINYFYLNIVISRHNKKNEEKCLSYISLTSARFPKKLAKLSEVKLIRPLC